MEDIINLGTYIQYLTYYIKIGIYVNKGTMDDALLSRCISLYNKYKSIEAADEISAEDTVLIRKNFKRLNLILKIDSNGSAVDVSKKEFQSKMLDLQPHESIKSDDMKGFLIHCRDSKINVLPGVPLLFIVKEGKYQGLLWQYTRLLFYITQAMISKGGSDAIQCKKIFDEAMTYLEITMDKVFTLEKKLKIEQTLALDKYLNTVLIKTGIHDKNINEGRNEIKKLFAGKGISNDPTVDRLIESISGHLGGMDFKGGNMSKGIISVAQTVAAEMKDDIGKDPEKIKGTITAIIGIFKDLMNGEDGSKMPPELKKMFDSVVTLTTKEDLGAASLDGTMEREIEEGLEKIIRENGLNRDDFFTSIQDGEGGVSLDKLQSILGGLDKIQVS